MVLQRCLMSDKPILSRATLDLTKGKARQGITCIKPSLIRQSGTISLSKVRQGNTINELARGAHFLQMPWWACLMWVGRTPSLRWDQGGSSCLSQA